MDEEQVIKQEIFSDSPIMFRQIYNNMKKGEMDMGNFVIFSENEKFICTIKSMKSTFSGDLELGVVVTGDCEALLQKALEEEAQQTLLAVQALSTDPVSLYQLGYNFKDDPTTIHSRFSTTLFPLFEAFVCLYMLKGQCPAKEVHLLSTSDQDVIVSFISPEDDEPPLLMQSEGAMVQLEATPELWPKALNDYEVEVRVLDYINANV